MTELTAAYPPIGYWAVVINEMKNQGIIDEKMAEIDTELTLQGTWDDAPLFAAGKSVVGHFSTLEAARMATEKEMDLVVVGKVATMFMGMMVRAGSDLDPENSGGIQQTLDRVVGENRTVGIGSWAGGDIPVHQIIADNYGYDFSEDGDFKVVSADYTALPRLLADGKVDMVSASVMHGGARYMMTDPPEVKGLYWPVPQMQELGYGVPPLINLIVRRDFLDERSEFVESYLSAWKQGLSEYFRNAVAISTKNEENISLLGAQEKAAAKYAVEWGVLLKEGVTETTQSNVYPEAGLDEAYIEKDKQFMRTVADAGLVDDDWENRLDYEIL
ncbi:hypothetical protein [Halogeometricum limi]|uniref:hypothetical protein n=1 Tax=Halogeometricum limi TaxID=555875 RepID=UPI000B7F7B83|nr:hypothetical protein [Halogeometricum limi]